MANCIGPYELLADLGSGAMGKVYRARDTRLDREVALKVLWPQLAEQPAAVARFEREARAVARLKHANVVAVHDIGAADGYHYLAMEYVAGCSLRELLQQPLPVDKALHYFKQILSGLGVAHAQGVIHRDLKPGNILIESATDTVKLADFGLARIMEEEVTLTRSGEMLGTLEYMAPELGQGEGAGRKSDLYAAGVVLYRLLTGRFPFSGATPSAILKAHECGTYPLASTVKAGLPSQADAILARLLACEPANRYADCQAVFADLEKWERGGEIPHEFAAAYEPIDHELARHRVPSWKRSWARVLTWYRYQWMELFNRTELTALRFRDEVTAAENELGRARRRREEATLLHNRVRARADEARAAMRECEKAAEQAHAAGDEAQVRQHLAAKLETKERAEDLEKEAAESKQLLALARQDYEGKAAAIAEMRHNADLLLARRRRAKMEMSVLGILPAGERKLGERLLAAGKLLVVPLLIIGGCYIWLRTPPSAPTVAPPVRTERNVPLAATRRADPVPSVRSSSPSARELTSDELAAVLTQRAIYESFDGAISARRVPFTPAYIAGKFGLALEMPDQKWCDYQVWPEFLTQATIMSWVKVRDATRRTMFWMYDVNYPSAFYYPDHYYKLAMHFLYGRPVAQTYLPYPTLAQSMEVGVWYHLTQSWGPDGFKAYLNGEKKFNETSQLSGVSMNPTPPPGAIARNRLQLGTIADANYVGCAFDDFAVFRTQLSDNEVAYFANKTKPIPE